MQTFSNMRRNSTYKQTCLNVLLFVGICAYESIASMYMLLPPLLGVIFVLFLRYDREDRFYKFIGIIVAILLIEAENNVPLGMIVGIFLVLSLFIAPRILVIIDTPRITRMLYVILAYIGFYIMLLIGNLIVGNINVPHIWLIAYYMFIEIIIVMFL